MNEQSAAPSSQDSCDRGRVDRFFLLHPGIGDLSRHWEHCHDASFIARVEAGDIRVAGLLVSSDQLPPAWMAGRFFAPLMPHRLDATIVSPFEWAEVTAQVKVDVEAGMARVPSSRRQDCWRLVVEAGGQAPDHVCRSCYRELDGSICVACVRKSRAE